MSGLPFGKKRGGGLGTKRPDLSRQYRDGRIVLSFNQWRVLREWVWRVGTAFAEEGLIKCHMCGCYIWTIAEMALDHWKSPRGLGGGYRDDRFVKPACHKCNSEKGSKRDV
jgi:hypothetical protein